MNNEQTLPLDARVCNCAGCRVLLMRLSEAVRIGLPPIRTPEPLAGWIDQRPYCFDCLTNERRKA